MFTPSSMDEVQDSAKSAYIDRGLGEIHALEESADPRVLAERPIAARAWFPTPKGKGSILCTIQIGQASVGPVWSAYVVNHRVRFWS